MLRALADHASPPRFVSLGAKVLAQRNHLNARRLLLGDVGLVLLGNVGSLRLDPGSGSGDHLLLLIVQLGPGALVDQDADLGTVKSRIDPVFGLFMPAKVEDSGDWPAIAVDHAALQRSIDLARRGLHHGGAERLKEIAIYRGDAQL